MYGTDSHAASSFTSTNRGEGRDREKVRKRDSGRKTERGLGGETTEMEKKQGKKERESAHTQRGEKAGAPKHQRLLRARNEGVTQ